MGLQLILLILPRPMVWSTRLHQIWLFLRASVPASGEILLDGRDSMVRDLISPYCTSTFLHSISPQPNIQTWTADRQCDASSHSGS